MAAAYPTHALSRSGAVGWRGLVTHSRGGASKTQVRVFGSWFRLADETFIKPIKEAEEEPALQEPEHVPTSQASVPALEVGQSVDARFGRKRGWFPGVVRHINEDGTLAIDFDDGDQEERVKHARQRKTAKETLAPLAPTLSGRLRTAPQRLNASVLAAPQYKKQGSAREASRREEPALQEEEEEEATTTPRPSSFARAAAVAVVDEAEQLHLPASASSSGVRTSNHGRFRGRVCRDSEGNTVQGGGLQLHLSASASSGGSASAKLKQATLTTAAAGSVLLSLATSPKLDHKQATNADPPAKRQRTDPTPPTPLLAEDRVRRLMEAKELKDKELIDEDEYKQIKAAIIGTVVG